MTVILSTSFRHNRNNRWSGISENTHLYVWQNQGTLHLTKITSLRNHSRHANHIHKTKCCTSNPAPDPPFLWLPHTLYNLFMNQVENILPSSPSSRGSRETKQKFKSWFRHPPQVWFYEDKKKIPPLQRNLVICRSFFMYVQWLGKNYCICEGTYLWFKA